MAITPDILRGGFLVYPVSKSPSRQNPSREQDIFFYPQFHCILWTIKGLQQRNFCCSPLAFYASRLFDVLSPISLYIVEKLTVLTEIILSQCIGCATAVFLPNRRCHQQHGSNDKWQCLIELIWNCRQPAQCIGKCIG